MRGQLGHSVISRRSAVGDDTALRTGDEHKNDDYERAEDYVHGELLTPPVAGNPEAIGTRVVATADMVSR